MELLDVETRPLRRQLEQVRHDHFNARTPSAKARCRQRDAELRAKIADLLKENGMPADEAVRKYKQGTAKPQGQSGPSTVINVGGAGGR